MLQSRFPELKIPQCSLERNGTTVISIAYPFDARTPRMLYEDGREADVRSCFVKALDSLVKLHKEYKIF